MTTRIEPQFGTSTSTDAPSSLLAGIFGNKQSIKSHEVILADALQAFSEATTKLDAAHATIQAQVESHQLQAEQHKVKALVAGESLSRLERVRGRITDLLA